MAAGNYKTGEVEELTRLPLLKTGGGYDLLSGVRVLDLTSSVAGPFATMLLGDMGAEILKVERPGHGDDTRSWGPPFLDGESLWFLSVNRNKKSITLNIQSEDGREIFERLVKESDVILLNQPPQTARKLRTDPETIRALNPSIIYCSITGFGVEGDRADWACYDLIAEGYSGIMDLTGEPENAAQKIGAPAADMLAGQDAALGVVSSLFERSRSGKGHFIDIALVDSMTRILTCRLVPLLGSGEQVTRTGGKDSVIAIYQTFDTADLPITLGLGNDAIWARFWAALDRPDMVESVEYTSNEKRREHRNSIVKEIQRILLEKPRAYWLDLGARARIPLGPINRLDEVARDPLLAKRHLFYKIHDNGRDIPQVGTGIRIDGKSNQPRCAPPRLGAETNDILAGLLDYSAEDIAKFRSNGVI